jgi:hypothetical protein
MSTTTITKIQPPLSGRQERHAGRVSVDRERFRLDPFFAKLIGDGLSLGDGGLAQPYALDRDHAGLDHELLLVQDHLVGLLRRL